MNFDIDGRLNGLDFGQIISKFKVIESVKRYNWCKPNLDDVRSGFARINSRGIIKWIPEHKLSKKMKILLFAKAMATPLVRRINYSEIARNMFTVEPL